MVMITDGNGMQTMVMETETKEWNVMFEEKKVS